MGTKNSKSDDSSSTLNNNNANINKDINKDKHAINLEETDNYYNENNKNITQTVKQTEEVSTNITNISLNNDRTNEENANCQQIDLKVRNFSCALINARSVGNKAANIIELILEYELDLLIITETWLNSEDDAKMKEITPSGYTLFSHSRDCRRGGGLAVLCRSNLKCEMKKCSKGYESFELMQLEITKENKHVSLFAIYRPEPNNSTMKAFFNEFEDLMEKASVIRNELLISGDFNIHLDEKTNPSAHKLLEVITTFNLVQHVTELTHESGHILDLVITRPTDFISDVLVREFFSDHKIITFQMKLKKSSFSKRWVMTRNFKDIDINALNEEIDVYFSSMTQATCINEFDTLASSYDSTFTELINKHAPLKPKLVTTKPKAPWMNLELLNEKRSLRKFERRWRYSKNVRINLGTRNKGINIIGC